ncbi:MAG: hypothetical protein AAFY55_00095 [Bacteroidota bacterium]
MPGTLHTDEVAPHAAPLGFRVHTYRHAWTVPHDRAAVWAWLNDPATFTDGQVPPYRVEFVSPYKGGPMGFSPGVLNVHHGPGILFAGVLGAITPPVPGRTAYRDLRYFYGSYALSLRLVRPTRLQFWADDAAPGSTQVMLQLDAFVARWFNPAWSLAQRAFWAGFGDTMTKQVARRSGSSSAPSLVYPAALALGATLGVAALAARRSRTQNSKARRPLHGDDAL